ncbi:MAG: hypothetical protein QOJ85_4346, partial [Solirubrobacteraceae bacterium]|nr:hypothetical protein [Solirubrobacteraceae bacterium]
DASADAGSLAAAHVDRHLLQDAERRVVAGDDPSRSFSRGKVLVSQPGELHSEQCRDDKRGISPATKASAVRYSEGPESHAASTAPARSRLSTQAEHCSQWSRPSKPRSASSSGDGCAGADGKSAGTRVDRLAGLRWIHHHTRATVLRQRQGSRARVRRTPHLQRLGSEIVVPQRATLARPQTGVGAEHERSSESLAIAVGLIPRTLRRGAVLHWFRGAYDGRGFA